MSELDGDETAHGGAALGNDAPPGAAVLMLEDGRSFSGRAFGAQGQTLGEVVFCTGMTGYQETLTDPSYHRQIVVATAPHIGNTGWNAEDDESGRIWVAGLVVRELAAAPSSWRASDRLDAAMLRQDVAGIRGIDTRAVTRHVRERGAMRGGIFSGAALAGPEELRRRVTDAPAMEGASLAAEVSTRKEYVVPAQGSTRFRVVALDLGIKSNTPRMLAQRGVETHVLPAGSSWERVAERAPDGLFLSNGPGDPATADPEVELVREAMRAGVPLFGICFGNQILGRALGRATYKMRYGHRGVNVPVIDTATGRVAITAQNHGFAVQGEAGERFDTPFGAAEVSHWCPNDGTVEGIRCLEVPAFSVQYHPEAAAGPHDAAGLFDEFIDLMAAGGGAGQTRSNRA